MRITYEYKVCHNTVCDIEHKIKSRRWYPSRDIWNRRVDYIL